MYVRNARNREEVWLLDRIEEMGLDAAAFRSRDYVIAIDERSDEKAGFGRLRIHRGDDPACELTGIGVLEGWRGQGVGAHVVERLVEKAGDEGFETVYAFTDQSNYLAQFGFDTIDPEDLPEALDERFETKREVIPDAVSLRLSKGSFSVPDRLRERFKNARPVRDDPGTNEPTEDFGIETEGTTYKYDTG